VGRQAGHGDLVEGKGVRPTPSRVGRRHPQRMNGDRAGGDTRSTRPSGRWRLPTACPPTGSGTRWYAARHRHLRQLGLQGFHRPTSAAPRRRRRKSNKGLGWLGIRGPGPRLVRLALRLGSSPARGR
jgi:hypothetical protein